MKLLLVTLFYWMLSGPVALFGNAEHDVVQTFSNAHADEKAPTETETTPLKDFDVLNPLFILK
jgi:hypothetical protein